MSDLYEAYCASGSELQYWRMKYERLKAEIDAAAEISDAEIEAVAQKMHELGMRMVPDAKTWNERSNDYKRESRAEAMEIIKAQRKARAK